jgi:prevent-host-death family protein
MESTVIEVSVDELRANFTDCLQQVEQGKVLVITRRGKAIARIVPAGNGLKKRMDGLVKEGVISWGGKPLSPWEPKAINKGPGLVSDLVREERDSTDDWI